MKNSHKIWIITGCVLVITLAGAGALGLWAWTTPVRTALAQQAGPTATPGTGNTVQKTWQAYRDFFIQQFASRLGVTTDKVKEAYSGAYSDMLDQEVKDGKITQAQADQLKQDLANRAAQGDALPGFGPGEGRGHGFGKGGMRGGMFGLGDEMSLASFAKALKMTEADLTSALQSGKTIADVAKDKGVDIAQVKTSVLADLEATLDQAVTNGKLTQTQADAIYNKASSGFDSMVNQTWQNHRMPNKKWQNPNSFGGYGG